MSTLKLFTDPQLPRPQRVHLVINELNLDVCIQTVDLEQMEHKVSPTLRAKHHHPLTKLNHANKHRRLITSNSTHFGAVPCLTDSSANPCSSYTNRVQ
jgi:hypothetical protein